MSEKDDKAKFRDKCLSPLDRYNCIENIIGQGMPDVNVCVLGVDSWIEFKSPKEPKKPATPLFGSNHKLSQEQKNWHLTQRNAGGISWVLICTDKRWMLLDNRWTDDINELSIEQLLARSSWNAALPIKGDQWIKLRRTLASTKRSLTTTN